MVTCWWHPPPCRSCRAKMKRATFFQLLTYVDAARRKRVHEPISSLLFLHFWPDLFRTNLYKIGWMDCTLNCRFISEGVESLALEQIIFRRRVSIIVSGPVWSVHFRYCIDLNLSNFNFDWMSNRCPCCIHSISSHGLSSIASSDWIQLFFYYIIIIFKITLKYFNNLNKEIKFKILQLHADDVEPTWLN